jgi:undecaprenyl-phosphate galactose phosphotransferase
MPKMIAFWLGAVILVMLSRGIARAMWRRSPAYVQNTLILGADAIGQRVAAKILRHPEYGINVLGFIDSVQPTNGSVDSSPRPPLLGEPSELPGLAEALGVERVIVAFSQERLSELVAELRALRIRDVQVDLVPRFYDVVGPGADFHTVEGMPLVSLPRARLSASALLVKRVLDVAMSIAGLVCLSPLFAYLAIRVKLDSPGPVLFRHERVGRDGKRFRLAKFRTMYVAKKGSADAVPIAETGLAAEFERDFKLRDDPRVTPFGTWLRRTSLDELPQLWNVLRGDMSLIGPRPLVAAETARWEEAIADLLAVKPGITGYWQINGRSEADYTERIRLELSYVNNWSLGLDLAILAKTAGVLVSRRGAY